MRLPVNPPLLPMLAKRVDELPAGAGWIYEPKWDGFRALVFRDGDELLIQSRDGKPLDRYFPELAAPLKAQLPARCVLDGEIVIARANALDFEALQLRLHPAASRAKMLSQQIPASVVFFDLLCEGQRDLRGAPFRERRAAMMSLLGGAAPPLHVTPATEDLATAQDWFKRFEGAGLDGVIRAWCPEVRSVLRHSRAAQPVIASRGTTAVEAGRPPFAASAASAGCARTRSHATWTALPASIAASATSSPVQRCSATPATSTPTIVASDSAIDSVTPRVFRLCTITPWYQLWSAVSAGSPKAIHIPWAPRWARGGGSADTRRNHSSPSGVAATSSSTEDVVTASLRTKRARAAVAPGRSSIATTTSLKA